MSELQAGPELDALVAERVMGWKVYQGSAYLEGERDLPHCWQYQGRTYKYDGEDNTLFFPSTLIADAWEVLRKLVESKAGEESDSVDLCFYKGGQCAIVQNVGSKHERVLDVADSWDLIPPAICRAALAAVSAPATGEPAGEGKEEP